jgi:hypothetical protein
MRLDLSRFNDQLRAGRPGFDSQQGKEFFSSSQRPARLRSPPSLLFNGYRGSCPGSKVDEADHSPEIKSGGAILPGPIRLHGVVLN